MLERLTNTSKFSDDLKFKFRDLDPDMRLDVFGNGIQVHSAIPKVHSRYFYTFLESPGKEPPSETPAMFKYDWVSEIDEDDDNTVDWALVDKQKCKDPQYDDSKLNLSATWQMIAFKSLIHAMYGMPYHLATAQQLVLMTKIADFCLAGPVLLRPVNGALLDS
ncbi:hypothetical protein BDZ45DRAFT_290496 [Acephala macrosclerotiorum]|nr:hypothetical protein BDZ45DRAFT_290496 [Acephala macrosclerotiorum]